VSLLMLVVVILFAPTLLGVALLASRLEARFLDPPGTVPGGPPVRRRGRAPGAATPPTPPARTGTGKQAGA
jgi:hypothetical protein